jgi:hypothetical protein
MPDGLVNDDQLGETVVTPFTPTMSQAPPEAQPVKAGTRVRRGVPPSVNIRVTVPVLKSRFYFALMGGRERRSRERLAVERRRNPVATRPNILFILLGALALYIVTLGTFLGYAAMSGT